MRLLQSRWKENQNTENSKWRCFRRGRKPKERGEGQEVHHFLLGFYFWRAFPLSLEEIMFCAII